MEFPTIKGESDPHFDKRECRVCGARGLHEPNSFATLEAGAMEKVGNVAAAAFDHLAWLPMSWHGAHTDLDGDGKLPDTGGHLKIVDDCPSGQFAIYFCSTGCLRTFLNECVDALEKKIRTV